MEMKRMLMERRRATDATTLDPIFQNSLSLESLIGEQVLLLSN